MYWETTPDLPDDTAEALAALEAIGSMPEDELAEALVSPGSMPEEPPDDLPDEPQEAPPESQEGAARAPDEILDPGTLVPVDAILARVEGITAQDVATSIALSTRILQIATIRNDDEMAALDELRDRAQAHQAHVKSLTDPFCEVANRLHKGMTGLRNVALDRIPDAIPYAGRVIAVWVRAKEQAEQERQAREREKALAAERERLRLEAEARDAEAKRLADAAHAETDAQARAILQAEADRASGEALEATTAAHTVIAPPVVQQEVEKPKGATVASAWKALPAHAEAQEDMPLNDLRALVIYLGSRAKDGDDSLLRLVKVDWTAANATAKAQREAMRIPGLRAVDQGGYRKRR